MLKFYRSVDVLTYKSETDEEEAGMSENKSNLAGCRQEVRLEEPMFNSVGPLMGCGTERQL